MKILIINVVGFVVFNVVTILRKFNIVFTIYSDMFGHQAWNIEYHIRRHIRKYNKFPKLIGVQSTSLIPNYGLYRHHKNYGIVVLLSGRFITKLIMMGVTYQKKLPNGRDLNSLGSSAFAITVFNKIFSDSDILINSNVAMPLTNTEIKEANNFLDKYNLERGKYMCFRDRDVAYMKEKSKRSIYLNKKDSSFVIREYNLNAGTNDYDNSRNTLLKSFYKGVEELDKVGVKSVRYGALSNEQCENRLVLDYSFSIRDENYDVSDLFLMEGCKFYIGPPSGDETLAMAFNKPICSINSFPWPYVNIPFRSDCIYMPKKIWIKNEKRFLKLSEMAEIEKKYNRNEFIDRFTSGNTDFELIDNSEEEIMKVMIEMNDRLDGRWDVKRDIFKKYLTKDNLSFSSNSILSTTFLEMNPDIL
jgi:putative glycosyltransferase (TIGR04372 family)